MVNPGSQEPAAGREYPSLEKYPPPVDPNATVNYPTDAGLPPMYAASFDGQPPASPPPPPSTYPQPGYPPPPAMPYPGYPQYQQAPYPYAYGAYGRPPGTNGKAIASLVTSLIGIPLYGLPSIAGLILGIMAMRETKQTGQEGYGLALAGVIVGALATVGWLIVLVFIIVVAVAATSSPSYY